jgi:hypothetical protein
MELVENSEIIDYYEIHLDSYLQKCWEEWFDGMNISYLENGETLLSGLVVDQSALYGILARLRDMNIKLISVKKV